MKALRTVFFCFLTLIGVLSVSVVNEACSPFTPNPEIYPTPKDGYFHRRTQVPLRPEKVDAAVVFIGGFSEQALIHMRTLYEQMPPLNLPGKQYRAFYAWDGGRGCLLFHSTKKIQRELNAFIRVNPEVPLVFIGHSYGGSAVMDVLRHIDSPHGPVAVVTIDPVSRRKRSMPRKRAKAVAYWLNVYCSPYCTPRDVVPMMGGAWRYCSEADSNVVFSGRERDKDCSRYQHAHPQSLMTESRNSAGASPLDLLNRTLPTLTNKHE